jgi:glycosyltransferase involved in cell wall biosynthesis
MSANRRLSIVIPAFNEAENILGTLAHVTEAVTSAPLDYEILVVDDGSTDGTATLVKAHLHRFPGTRLLLNERNRGFGWTYRRGVDAASLDFIVMVHGDDAWGAETLRDFFSHVGEADIVIGHTRDMWASRTWTRALLSKTFTAAVNAITGRQLEYYNGLQIHRAAVLKSLDIQSTGYGFQAEVLVKALSTARTFIEVPMELTERRNGNSKAFTIKNALDVARTLRLLYSLDHPSAASAAAMRLPLR